MPVGSEHIRCVPYSALAEFEAEATYGAIFEAIVKYVPEGGSVLDVGCGRGEFMRMLSENGYETYGCDMDDRCVSMGGRYGEVRKMTVEEVSPERFGGKHFDCAVASHVLEHVENPREAVGRMVSVSRGMVVISVPNPYYSPFVVSAMLRRKVPYVNRTHLQSWDYAHFKTFIEVACGLRVVEWFHDSVALPVFSRARWPLARADALPFLEGRPLRAAFPRFCRSITAVVEAEGSPGR